MLSDVVCFSRCLALPPPLLSASLTILPLCLCYAVLSSLTCVVFIASLSFRWLQEQVRLAKSEVVSTSKVEPIESVDVSILFLC